MEHGKLVHEYGSSHTYLYELRVEIQCASEMIRHYCMMSVICTHMLSTA